ncbi:MAG: DUF5060 domain-containing protein [Cyclobacteriaceae bacterium]
MNTAKFIFSFFLVTTFNVGVNIAQSHKRSFANNSVVKVEQWEVIDISFKLNKIPSGNPFDVVFGAVFKGPDNQSLKMPGFHNGDNEWVIRFSASKSGNWSFETYASHDKLAGQKGNVTVVKNPNPKRKGSVIIDPEKPQHFIYEDGSPYFCLAFELDWLFALDYDKPTGLPRTKQIIEDVKNNGFNQVVMNVYAYDVGWHTDKAPDKYEYRRPNYTPFKGTNENPDFSTLNTDFFKHFDKVIQHLDNEGIIAHVMIYVWNKKVNWPQMYSKDDNRYFDYVISRYQAYSNVWWDVSKEALDYGRCDIPYINERIDRIRTQDAYKRLVSVHDYEYCSREADRVDYISIQNWRPNIYDHSLLARERHHKKPIVNIEHGGYEVGPYKSFEGNYTNPETCLIRNYECVFAGVYSSYYWQNTSWNIVIYDPFNPEHTFDAPRFDYYKHLSQLFTRYNYNELYPVAQKFTTNDKQGLDNLSTGGLPLTNGKDLFMYLIPERCEFISTVLPKPENEIMEVTWFNPFTGEYIEKGEQKWSNWEGFASPWAGTMSVLIVKLK